MHGVNSETVQWMFERCAFRDGSSRRRLYNGFRYVKILFFLKIPI
jgi:hypothetical protein